MLDDAQQKGHTPCAVLFLVLWLCASFPNLSYATPTGPSDYPTEFSPVKTYINKVKAKAISLCKKHQLTKLSKAISVSKHAILLAFFSVKTNKPHMPFRCIISERDAWQQNLSCCLLGTLMHLSGRSTHLEECNRCKPVFAKPEHWWFFLLMPFPVLSLHYIVSYRFILWYDYNLSHPVFQ